MHAQPRTPKTLLLLPHPAQEPKGGPRKLCATSVVNQGITARLAQFPAANGRKPHCRLWPLRMLEHPPQLRDLRHQSVEVHVASVVKQAIGQETAKSRGVNGLVEETSRPLRSQAKDWTLRRHLLRKAHVIGSGLRVLMSSEVELLQKLLDRYDVQSCHWTVASEKIIKHHLRGSRTGVGGRYVLQLLQRGEGRESSM